MGKYHKLLYAPSEKQQEIRTNILQGEEVVAGDVDKFQKETPNNESQDLEEIFDPDFRPTSTVEYESRGAIITAPGIFTLNGKPVNVLVRGRRYKYQYHVEFTQGAINVRYGMLIKTISGFELGGATSAPLLRREVEYQKAGNAQIEFQFKCNLNPGTYFINAGVTGTIGEEDVYLHRLLDACVFKVMPVEDDKVTGIIDFCCEHTSIFAEK